MKKLILLAALILCVGAGWYFYSLAPHPASRQAVPATPPPSGTPAPAGTGGSVASPTASNPPARPDPALPVAPGTNEPSGSHPLAPRVTREELSSAKITDADAERDYHIVLNELVRRDAGGRQTSIPLPRQADLPALRQTWSSYPKATGEILFPVAYAEGDERILPNRRLVSSQIRIELSPGADLPANLPPSVEVKRFDFAPQYAVLTMKDSFAALDGVEQVRGLAGIRRAEVLLAKQQGKRSLPNDPLAAKQWHLRNTGQSGGLAGIDLNVEPVWKYPIVSPEVGWRGKGIIIGVVDDGLQTAHPDLAGHVLAELDHDWNDNTPDDPSPPAGSTDDHGTQCAGVAGAVGNNGVGVSGSAPEAGLAGLRLIAADETDADEADAFSWRNDTIHLKSNSWGPPDGYDLVLEPGALAKAALRNATLNGRGGLGEVILFAGGNGGDTPRENSNYDGYANSVYTLAVGAVANSGKRSYYSEPGANLVVTAPSSGGTLGITTTDLTGSSGSNTSSGDAGNYSSDFGGTSSACPAAAGVVALLLQSNPGLGWRDVKEILIRSATKIDATDTDWITNGAGFHFNHNYGAGLINAQAAVALAAKWQNLPVMTAVVSTQSNLGLAIPDNKPAGVTRTFDLSSSNLRVEQVTVKVGLKHSAVGNVGVTLTSPAGTVSRLAEVHPNNEADKYLAWTFMTVRCWGERAKGKWTLQIWDGSRTGNTTGGTLNSAELTVLGSIIPTAEVTAPTSETNLTVGTPATVSATATPGSTNTTISRVDFFANSSQIGSATAAPYSVSWTPAAAGDYALTARAVDNLGTAGTSAAVAVTAGEIVPAVSSATLSPAPRAFSDQALTVAVKSNVPTLSCQWQASTDGVNFAPVAGQTGATLSPSPSFAGRVWRCVVTPRTSTSTGAATSSDTTMVLTRPPRAVLPGQSYSYQADLVLRAGSGGQTATYSLGAGTTLPGGLSLSSSGLLNGTVTAAPGTYPITLVRSNGSETVDLAFNLAVNLPPKSYSAWLGDYPGLTNTAAEADPDRDGKSNLAEYFEGNDPATADAEVADRLGVTREGDTLVLRYARAKYVTGVTEAVTTTEDLKTWTAQGVTFEEDVDRGTYLVRTARKSLNASGRTFLRLELTPAAN